MTMHPNGLEIMRRRGYAINPDVALEHEQFDPIQWRREQAGFTLAAQVPARFVGVRADHPEVIEWARGFVADPKGSRSLLLVGPTGTGKTHQMFGALRLILEALAERGRGLDFRVTTHPDMNDSLMPKPDGSNGWALEPLMKADLLLLDDLGTGKTTEYTGAALHRLVDHRWANNLPSIYTTNLPAAAFVAAMGDRVQSRLGHATRVVMEGADRRWGA